MKRTVSAIIIVCTGLTACAPSQNENQQNQKTTTDMTNLISIVEIPVTDFSRAVTFYQAILDIHIEAVDMAGTQMGVLPSEENAVHIVLVKGSDYTPTMDGPVLYLNAGSDLRPMLERIVSHGGEVIVPRTEISPEMGYFALFTDTEGNKLGLHSAH